MTQTPPDLPLRALFDAQFQASRAQIDVPLPLRLDRVRRIRALVDAHCAALAHAVQADFGVRSPRLTEVADFFVLRSLLGDLDRHTGAWMKTRRVRTPLYLLPPLVTRRHDTDDREELDEVISGVKKMSIVILRTK